MHYNFKQQLPYKEILLDKIRFQPYIQWWEDYEKYDRLDSIESIKFHLDISKEILEDFGIKLSDNDLEKIDKTLNDYSKYVEARSEIVKAVITRRTFCRHDNVIDINEAISKNYHIVKQTKKDCFYCPDCGLTLNLDAYRSNKRFWQKIDGENKSQNTIY
jgi:methionine synthase II (cobalamin-independent)